MVVISQHQGKVNIFAHQHQKFSPKKFYCHFNNIQSSKNQQERCETFQSFSCCSISVKFRQYRIYKILKNKSSANSNKCYKKGQNCYDTQKLFLFQKHIYKTFQFSFFSVFCTKSFRLIIENNISQKTFLKFFSCHGTLSHIRITYLQFVSFKVRNYNIMFINTTIKNSDDHRIRKIIAGQHFPHIFRTAASGISF